MKIHHRARFSILAFFGLFLTKKGRNWQKWRKLAKSKSFDEIFWNLVCRCFPTKKMLQIFFFWISAFFGRFLTKKQPKKIKKNLAKSKPFDEIFWNLVCRCFPTKINASKNLFLDFGLFWPFFNQKTAKIDKKLRKLAKPKPFGEIFWNLVFAGLKSC